MTNSSLHHFVSNPIQIGRPFKVVVRLRDVVIWLALFVTAPAANAIDFIPADLVYREDFVGETGLPTTAEVDLSGTGSLTSVTGLLEIADGRLRLIGDHDAPQFSSLTTSLQAAVGSNGTGNFGVRTVIRAQQPFLASPAAVELFVSMHFGTELVRFHFPVMSSGPGVTRWHNLPAPNFFLPIAYSVPQQDILDAISAGSPYEVDVFFKRSSRRAWATVAVNGRVHMSEVFDSPDIGSTPIDAVEVGLVAAGFGGAVTSLVDIEAVELYAANSTPTPPALVVSTRKVSALTGITGPIDSGDRFGISMANIGDQNGDGIDDLAVGADYDDDGGTRAGAVYILFMNANGTVASEQKISALSGNFPGTISAGDRFGQPIEVLADFDGDGRREIAVGARRSAEGGTARGAVWILDLNTDGTVESATKISENQGGFVGTLPDESNFSAMTSLGDVNGDGFDDLAVGAWGDAGVGASVGGTVWVLFLDASGVVQGQQAISATQGGLTGTLDVGDRFGASLAGIGDLDGDGVPDLAVGADSADIDFGGGNIIADVGEVWILHLKADGTVRDTNVLKASGASGGTFLPISSSDVFGLELTALGDFNGDGIPDLAAGAAGAEVSGDAPDSGAAFLMYMNVDGTLKDVQVISHRLGGFDPALAGGDFLGVGLRALGDLDGDGRLDLALGVTGDDDGVADAGAFYLANIEPSANCGWVRHLDSVTLTGGFSAGVETFDFSTVPLDSNGDAGFSNGHDFGRFGWTSLTVTSDIDLFGSSAVDGTLWVTDQFAPPIQASPGAGGPSGSIQDNDDFRLDLSDPMAAAGLEILGNRADAGEAIEFLDAAGNLIATFPLPGSQLGAPGGDGGGFVGLTVCEGHPGISSIVVREGNLANTDDDDIGFTNVVTVPVPEPGFKLALVAGLFCLVAFSRTRRRRGSLLA